MSLDNRSEYATEWPSIRVGELAYEVERDLNRWRGQPPDSEVTFGISYAPIAHDFVQLSALAEDVAWDFSDRAGFLGEESAAMLLLAPQDAILVGRSVKEVSQQINALRVIAEALEFMVQAGVDGAARAALERIRRTRDTKARARLVGEWQYTYCPYFQQACQALKAEIYMSDPTNLHGHHYMFPWRR